MVVKDDGCIVSYITYDAPVTSNKIHLMMQHSFLISIVSHVPDLIPLFFFPPPSLFFPRVVF